MYRLRTCVYISSFSCNCRFFGGDILRSEEFLNFLPVRIRHQRLQNTTAITPLSIVSFYGQLKLIDIHRGIDQIVVVIEELESMSCLNKQYKKGR